MTQGVVTALLLVDLQRDYLDRPGLVPGEAVVVASAALLLRGFRERGAPIVHVRTIVQADGSDAMPHWRTETTDGQRSGLTCVDGTPGALPPPALAEAEGELVAAKQHYRGFADPRLAPWLRELGVRRVVIAGVYTHACVRETALDAYEHGFEVLVASDAVGSDDPAHAESTRAWLEGRAAHFVPVADIVGLLAGAGAGEAGAAADDRSRWEHRDPCATDHVLAVVVEASRDDVHAAALAVRAAQSTWAAWSPERRADVLEAWAGLLAARCDDLTSRIVEQVGKPVAAARDEVDRAVAHVRTAAWLVRRPGALQQAIAAGVDARQRPVGVIGAITPWNNPLALACGKIGPALAFGNGVILKPAPEGAAVTQDLAELLVEAGAPQGILAVVNGGAETGRLVVEEPIVGAIAVTGSIATGRDLAVRCARLGKALQAELGGNNAAIVLADADLDAVVPTLVRGSYSYSGQRCTALRRYVVVESILDEFVARVAEEIDALVVGDPRDPATDLGPLISRAARDRVAAAVAQAGSRGAVVVRDAVTPAALEGGAWLTPGLVVVHDRSAAIVQQETFGPVVVIQPAADLDDALAAANGVEQGLVMALCSTDPAARERFAERAQAGILLDGAGPLPIHPDAPFGGWKASGVGPPEHGEWDIAFVTRAQARYGPAGA